MAEQSKNFAVSTVATAPSPATSGTSLVVASGHGTRFPTAPFNAIVAPIGDEPTPDNAEVVRVTAKSTDTLTITRAQESSTARTVVVGDRIWAGPTAKTLVDLQSPPVMRLTKAALQTISSGGFGAVIDLDTTADDHDPGGLDVFDAVLASDYLQVKLASYVSVEGHIHWATNVTGNRRVTIAHQDSSGASKKDYTVTTVQSVSGDLSLIAIPNLKCDANDRLLLAAFQTSGGNLNTAGGGVNNQLLSVSLTSLI